MCCFSGRVEIVSDTEIFARSAEDERQFLVYSMSYATSGDVALVLPLPVPADPLEDAVQFINLKHFPTFFDDLRKGFPMRFLSRNRSRSAGLVATETLQVHDVGDFEASFVPQLEDFNRLDERFRLPSNVWDQLPQYHDYGFAVFKLKAKPERGLKGLVRKVLGRRSRPHRVHPMAFSFPRRDPGALFFPTVHVHDGEVHPLASFDHMLYCQPDPGSEHLVERWEPSEGCASEFIAAEGTRGIVAPDQRCWRTRLRGRLPN